MRVFVKDSGVSWKIADVARSTSQSNLFSSVCVFVNQEVIEGDPSFFFNIVYIMILWVRLHFEIFGLLKLFNYIINFM